MNSAINTKVKHMKLNISGFMLQMKACSATNMRSPYVPTNKRTRFKKSSHLKLNFFIVLLL
nr:MAG TPA: hypothetical protein [Caudoviricetes sp.]